MTREEIAKDGEEVVSQKRKARSIGKDEDAEVGMGANDAGSTGTAIRSGHYTTSIGQCHLIRLNQTLEYGGDMKGRFICLKFYGYFILFSI